MKTRRIKKIAIIGSGIMGSGIACHFANIGVDVLLLDIIPRELTEKENSKGLSFEDKVVRNRLVNEALSSSLKSKPSPIYHQKFANRITTGNLEDDIHKVANVDWIMEVVVERLDIKKLVFEKLEKFRTPGTLITSNTSSTSEGRLIEVKFDDVFTLRISPPSSKYFICSIDSDSSSGVDLFSQMIFIAETDTANRPHIFRSNFI